MTDTTLLLVGVFALLAGIVIGYLIRQQIAKKRIGTIEQKLQEKIRATKEEAQKIINQAHEKADEIIKSAKFDIEKQRKELIKMEEMLVKREGILNEKAGLLDKKESELKESLAGIEKSKQEIDKLKDELVSQIERITQMTKDEAKELLLKNIEKEYEVDILARIKKMEEFGKETLEKRAKDILATAIQRYALPQCQEISTTTVMLPNEDVKGKIIGKEGRNIRTLEKLTGAEFIIDETPETVVISCFDPVRRHIAKVALERLIQDGRIQPARIEETVAKVQEEIQEEIKQAGEQAAYEVGVLDLHPKLLQILGRLKFRTSYAQNVLLHSIEVAHLAGMIAAELGANVKVAKKGGLLHDIGKAIDQEVEGSHVKIGIKILEKFGVEKAVIDAMKSHHEEFPFENIEAVIVKVADQISGARPGARRDTVENYIKRLEDLERIATSFPGVEKAWALQAGREIRIFVKPQQISDLECYKLAKDVANKIEEELKYPGEIKVTIIRELRVIEYAR
ncbi:Ribonuclease Y [bacterium HR34]|nr:Ribonuclease Y [bacterium HR34]